MPRDDNSPDGSEGSDRDGGAQARVLGTSHLRLEDEALLRGQGRYADDVGTSPGTLHACIIRSSVAHARIRHIETSHALAQPGVACVLTGEDVRQMSDPFLVAVKQRVDQWSLAVDRVRYVGEPVVLVVAQSRYAAEDAAELVEIEYDTLPVVVDVLEALEPDAPLLHEDVGSNEAHRRQFSYGEPDAQFEKAAHRVGLTVEYPRSSFAPMECFVVVAQYNSASAEYDILTNFQGPFSVQPVMARALRVPGSRLRLRTPADSGGSFGVKLSVFPYAVLMGLAARVCGRPVKWVEDRLEHLQSASSGPNRVSRIEAAVEADGKIQALRMENIEDYGAYLRAPMPGPLYRMQGAMTGAYDIKHLALDHRVVLTNKMPAALVRGFGGPQLYLALERLVQRIAVELELDPLEVIRRNLIQADAFPYRAAAGALYDSGDYQKAIDIAVGDGRLEALYERRDAARAAGRHYGIGFATVVEPSMSNMGYLSTLLSPEQRERSGPKNGAISMATVAVDALGSVSVTSDVTVQGQGHQTTIAQVVAQSLGLQPEQISVNLEIDTQKDRWSIAAGSYSCRFAPGAAVAVHIAAGRIRDRVARIAAKSLNVMPEEIEFGDGKVFARNNPDNAMQFARAAGTAHWSPILVPEEDEPGLQETATWEPEQLEPPNSKDQINTSLAYGFVFDICGVEIDPVTMAVRIDHYTTMHDAGRLLNPMLAEGQIRGAFVQGLSSAMYEEFVYDENGSFASGTLAEYLMPTVSEVPEIEILHIETPSPFTPLGAKGLAEGNCMSTPAAVANAVADALGVKDVPLPITPDRVNQLVAGEEPAAPEGVAEDGDGDEGRVLRGDGAFVVPAPPEEVWRSLLDPETLKVVIPGCRTVKEVAPGKMFARVSMGVGPVRGEFRADVTLANLVEHRSADLEGALDGPLGAATGQGHVTLEPRADGTLVSYRYEVKVMGKVAAVGGRMLDRAAAMIIRQFFERLASQVGDSGGAGGAIWHRLRARLGKLLGARR